MLTSTRTFGIELEVHLPRGRSHRDLAHAISLANVAARSEGYNHNTVNHWKVTTDGSLGMDGAEVVSPVLSGEAGIIEARRVADAMKAFGCTITVKCGFHVHVGAADLTVDQLRNVAILYVFGETAFDAIMPPSRRRDSNVYILSNRTAFGGNYDSEAVNRAIAAYKAAGQSKQRLIEVVSGANRTNGRDHGARYRKLNFHPLNRYGTVEFRQHSGTVEADKIANWVELCVRLVDRAMTGKPRSRPSTRPHDPANELNMMLSYLRVPPSLARYYRQRRRDLCDVSLARAADEAARRGRAWSVPAE